MIYLDHAATTPVDPEVAAVMQAVLQGQFGNPSSIHALGRAARAIVDDARDTISKAISADYSEIYFTAGGTEADNLALMGVMLAAPPNRRRLIVSSTEHHAVLHAARHLRSIGFELTELPVDSDGIVDPEELRAAMTDSTALVSIAHGNNEIGTIQDIARLSKVAQEFGALFHTDAVQSFGALPIHVGGMGCDLLSLSGHKVYGPKGVGALYIRSGVKVSPIMFGGSQEREKRPGTENTPAIAGFARAVEILTARRDADSFRIAEMRERFVASLEREVAGLHLNGHRTRRLPNNVNVSIEGADGAAVLMSLDRAGIAASSGSACSSGSIEPSHVLTAIGLPAPLASGGIRLTLGRSTTELDMQTAAAALAEIAARLRS